MCWISGRFWLFKMKIKHYIRLLALSIYVVSAIGCATFPRSENNDPRPPLINTNAFTNHVPTVITNVWSGTNYQEYIKCQ